MARKRHTAEQIVDKLREAEVEVSKGMTIGQVCKKLGIAEQTYYKW
jgi:transposase-like protein